MKRFLIVPGPCVALAGAFGCGGGGGNGDGDVQNDVDADGVTCSGHGDCIVTGGNAACDCTTGYHAEGLADSLLPRLAAPGG
jgi:hypothetical protein